MSVNSTKANSQPTGLAVLACTRRDVTKQDAEAWFGVGPSKSASNVIAMRGSG